MKEATHSPELGKRRRGSLVGTRDIAGDRSCQKKPVVLLLSHAFIRCLIAGEEAVVQPEGTRHVAGGCSTSWKENGARVAVFLVRVLARKKDDEMSVGAGRS